MKTTEILIGMSGSNKNKNEKSDRQVLVQRRLALYEDETFRLLLQACEWTERQDEEKHRLYQRNIGDNTVPVLPKKKPAAIDYSEEDLDENCNSESSTSGDEDESQSNSNNDSDEYNGNDITSDTYSPSTSTSTSKSPTSAAPAAKLNVKSDKTPKLSGKLQKRLIQDINRHADNLIRIDLPLPPSSNVDNKGEVNEETENVHLHLFPAAALFPKNTLREPVNVSDQAQVVKTLSEQLLSTSSNDAVVVVLLIQSGRFAGGVFRHGKCLAHRATVRYTVRKGQGKAQSVQDGSRRPKSVGSQLRRAGEEQLNADVKTTLMKWTEMGYIKSACLIFLACPKTMRSTVFSAADSSSTKTNSKSNVSDGMLSKDDDRIRKIPFDVGRATFHAVEVVHEVMMGVDLCHVQNHVLTSEGNDLNGSDDSVTTTIKKEIQDVELDPEEEKRKRKDELALDLPMAPIHIASREGKLAVLMDLLHKNNHSADDGDNLDVDRPAGYDCMTPLHFAAAASANVDPVTASALVSTLLIQAHADPTILDACGRPPYFLAMHDKVREAFRKARAILGEEYCDWDGGAKVGPSLTEDDLEAKKEREAEKKRRKKERQKEKKAKARAAAEVAEKRRIAEEEAKQAVEEGKRIRDGLSAKPTGANVCDFCQKVCKGRNASKNMFQRLNYKYCGTECVNNHKRELMAAAAMARFG
jgi:hypothetical protein